MAPALFVPTTVLARRLGLTARETIEHVAAQLIAGCPDGGVKPDIGQGYSDVLPAPKGFDALFQSDSPFSRAIIGRFAAAAPIGQSVKVWLNR
ncbi:MAG: hypothetical protein R3C25_11110 [Hyphomonadaceae bacterium]